MIKKVVIPEKTVKYVCELDEEQYNSLLANTPIGYSFNNFTKEKTKASICGSEFKKIETIKPIADDEVSINDVSKEKIYARYYQNEVNIVHCLDEDKYQFVTVNADDSQDYAVSYASLKGIVRPTINTPVYQFDNEHEFAGWMYNATKV